MSGILVNFLRVKSHIKHDDASSSSCSKSSYFNVPFQTKPQKHFDDLFLGFPHKTFSDAIKKLTGMQAHCSSG